MNLIKLVEKMQKEGQLPSISLSKKAGWDSDLMFHHFVPTRKSGKEEQYLLFKLWDSGKFGSSYDVMNYHSGDWSDEPPSAEFLPAVTAEEDIESYVTPKGFFHFVSISETEPGEMVVGTRDTNEDWIGSVVIPAGDPVWVDEEEFFRFAHW